MAADISGGGVPDLLGAAPGAKGFVTFINQGDGTFGQATTVPNELNEFGPQRIAVGDFNRDGKLDVAGVGVSNHETSVFIWLNQGGGTFASPTTVTLPSNAYGYALAAGDLDKDGKVDLVAAINVPTSQGWLANVAVFFGNGNGTFRPAVSYPTQGFEYLLLADLDADGKLDVVTSGQSGDGGCSVSALVNYGNGTLGPVQTKTMPGYEGQIVAGDIDHDGIQDVVLVNGQQQAFNIFLGRGDGTFSGPFAEPLGSWAFELDVLDMNGDGLPDIITGDGTNYVEVTLNSGTNTFHFPQSFSLGPAQANDAYFVIAADLNGDGRPDIATANANTNNISVLLAR